MSIPEVLPFALHTAWHLADLDNLHSSELPPFCFHFTASSNAGTGPNEI